MKVKLINTLQSNDALHKHSALDLVAYCARVSNPENK